MKYGNLIAFTLSITSLWLIPTTPAQCGMYTEDFESGLGGWNVRPDGAGSGEAILRMAGGVGDSGYIEGRRIGLSPTIIPESGQAGANLTGDLTAVFGNEIKFSYSARVFSSMANPDAPNVGFWGGPGFSTFWLSENIGSSLTPFLADWTQINFTIDANWSDAEAAANGWTRLIGSDSWANTLTNITEVQLLTGIGSNPGQEVITGIDEVKVQSPASPVPEPSSIALLCMGGLTLLGGYYARRNHDSGNETC